MRRVVRIVLRLGFVAAIAAFARKLIERRTEPFPSEPPTWPPVGTPAPPTAPEAAVAPPPEPAVVPPEPTPAEAVPAVAEAPAPAVHWVDPAGDVCPPSHPVKGKLASGLFHLPGMAAYNRTRPDRCYADEESAVRDGLTKAKR